jgi:hypothetical protein
MASKLGVPDRPNGGRAGNVTHDRLLAEAVAGPEIVDRCTVLEYLGGALKIT